MSKFTKSKYKPLTPAHDIADMTANELLARGNHWATVAAVASREAAFLRRASRQRKHAEAKAA